MIEKFTNLINLFSLNPVYWQIRKRFKENQTKLKSPTRQILIETQQPFGNQIGLGLFIPTLVKLTNSEPVAYSMLQENRISKIKQFIRHRFSIFPSFDCKRHVLIGYKEGVHSPIKNEVSELIKRNSNPDLFEKAEYAGIRIGDLIYDVYLRRTKQPTIDFEDPAFYAITSEIMQYTKNLLEYFDNHDVAAVCVSHCVYHFAVPARIAISRSILAFQVTGENIYRVTNESPHAYTDFKDFPKRFRELSNEIKYTGIAVARDRLNRRLNGEVGVDMSYSTISAFQTPHDIDASKFISNNGTFKVLVAIHDFFDSPHSYGDNLYPDFLIWLSKLNEISKSTPYEWYIKTHPDIKGQGLRVLQDFLGTSNNFRVVPSRVSHLDLINSGVNAVLTVYGTVASEYPLLGVNVVNASINNPHCAYSFSVTPKTRTEYEEVVRNLSELSPPEVSNEIYEYYFMRHIYSLKNWVYKDHEEYLRGVGGYDASTRLPAFKYFLKNVNKYPDDMRDRAVQKFLISDDIRIDRQHFDQ